MNTAGRVSPGYRCTKPHVKPKAGAFIASIDGILGRLPEEAAAHGEAGFHVAIEHGLIVGKGTSALVELAVTFNPFVGQFGERFGGLPSLPVACRIGTPGHSGFGFERPLPRSF